MARTKVLKRKKGDHTAENMRRAIILHRQGHSIRNAAKECNLYYPTLQRYVKKNLNIATSNLLNQRLTPNYDIHKIFTNDQENALAAYITECALKFYGLTAKDVRRIAFQMAVLNSIDVPENWKRDNMAGVEWLRSYRARHTELSLKKPEACSLARATAFNKESVKSFFENLKKVYDRNKSFGNGCRVYNLDETATTTVQKPQRVLGPKGRQNISKITSGEKGTLVTTCAIVCASGQAVPPVLVFPRKNYKDFMLRGAPTGSLGLASPSGWMNAELFVKVMEHFIEHTCASPQNPALLIMDNHESHLSIEALDLAKRSGVTVLTLHPHTTSKMQPLDVGLNGPFKVYYNTAIDSWLMRNPGKPVTIYNVAECVGQAYPKAMTPVNITAAFKKCGIFPYDADVFSEIDFLPSSVTDRARDVSPSSDVTNAESVVEVPFEQNVSASENRNADSPSLLEDTCANPILPSETVKPKTPSPVAGPSREYNEFSKIRATTPIAEEQPIATRSCAKPFKSPKEFMQPLKAGPRTGKRKPRKLGKSMVATDTPEKNLIAEERKKTQARKAAATKVKRPIMSDKKGLSKGKKKLQKKVIQSDPETSEEEMEVVCLSDSDLSGFEEEVHDVDDLNNLAVVSEPFKKLQRIPEEGDYVLVLFITKKLKIYYAAKIVEKTGVKYDVSFMRVKSKENMKFYMPLEPDLAEVNIKDIKMIFPKPTINGTKSRNSTYIFPLRLSLAINLR